MAPTQAHALCRDSEEVIDKLRGWRIKEPAKNRAEQRAYSVPCMYSTCSAEGHRYVVCNIGNHVVQEHHVAQVKLVLLHGQPAECRLYVPFPEQRLASHLCHSPRHEDEDVNTIVPEFFAGLRGQVDAAF